MIKNYFKIAWRNLWRNKLHSFINIFGLAIAFSICIILFLVAYFQFSYDSFHKGKSQLFRVSSITLTPRGLDLNSQMPLPIKSALENDIPDIENAVRVQMGRPENISYGDKNIEKIVTRTDPDFFKVFNFPVIRGNRNTALSGIGDIALGESMAKAIFGETDPIGKELKIGRTGEQELFIVTAVIEDCPKNSSIRFDAVARMESLPDYSVNKDNWDSNSSNVFVKISENSNKKLVENKLDLLVEKYYPAQLEQLKTLHPEIKQTSDLLHLDLTDITDIHFSGARSTPKMLVYAIMALGTFILLIACFNFVNLNLASSFKRSREVGVRKTLGAYKGQLFAQFWGEAFLLYFIGCIIGMGLAYQLLLFFNAQFQLSIGISTLFQPTFLVIMFGVFVLVTLIAGGYPALKMTNFDLVEVLKGNVSTKKPGVLRNTLLVSQFAISSLLICVSWVASQQLNFLRQKPVGFEREQVVSIPIGNQEDGRQVLGRMRNEMANDPNIISVTGGGGNMGRGRDRVTTRSTFTLDYHQNQISADQLLVDFGYLKTLQIPIVKGRDFKPEYATDTVNAVVVTESFVKAMGEKDPIGKFFGGEDSVSGSQIIGVVPDFNAYSPSEKTLPIVLHLSANEPINYIFLKVRSDDPHLVMARLQEAWQKVTQNAVFNASFLDENLQAWYEGESIMTNIFGFASAIAIFLSCLGLFAISLMLIELRTKEIGIRKVMGASIKNIVSMISLHFLKLVLISLLVALPIAWFIMHRWLENYQYRIEIQPFTFIGVGIVVVVVALATVGFHTLKAAIANPVKSLRTE